MQLVNPILPPEARETSSALIQTIIPDYVNMKIFYDQQNRFRRRNAAMRSTENGVIGEEVVLPGWEFAGNGEIANTDLYDESPYMNA
ncbi:hypothetical protein OESDEN_02923 [Oesophagostomum dentatum]|uniref:Uncharacterized protein n=1 Tax=Oesophagostomum dentatum TaxID=61180 RepID=A0A0B1TIN3_OESDE|nr:hypothetical protein OESDEN_02923 [Oesophagostomum dentatum]